MRMGKCLKGARRGKAALARIVGCAVAVGVVQMLPGKAALGTNGQWTQTTSGGLWSTTGNWLIGDVASGSGGTADFSQLNITADNTVHLDSARTIGTLDFGDTTPSNNWTLDNNGNSANTLTLAVGSGTPSIVVNNQTTTISAALLGTQGLSKSGAGTLLLTNSSDAYSGGTTINGGTLAIGASGAVLQSGGNVTVNSGATFNYGNGTTINNTGSAIGTLTLNNGTYRLSGGFGDFYLNKLVIGTTGGTLDFTGAGSFWTHFTGSGAGITVNTSSTWTEATGDSHIQNDTSALLPITINNFAVVTSSANFSNGTGGFGFSLLGGGNLYLNPFTPNSADFRVQNGFLQVSNMTALGTGAITLAGSIVNALYPDTTAVLQYMGATASSAKPLTLDGSGGTIWVENTGTTLTLTGVIGETGGTGRALSVYGDTSSGSTLILTAANTYTGPTEVIYGGILSIPTIANGGVASPLGAASNSPSNLLLGGGTYGGDGTLEYTGPTASTDRGVTLGNPSFMSTIDVATAGTTLTMSGQFIGGGLTKAGPGTLLLTNTSNNYTFGTNINAGTLTIGVSGAVLPSGGAVTVNSGATFNYGNGSSITNGTSPIGTLTLNNGTYRVSGGSGDFYLNQLVIGATGGSVDFTGTSEFWTHFSGSGAGITVDANSTWTGASNSEIRNDTSALLPVTINNFAVVTSSANFANGSNGFGFGLLGGGTLYLKNPTGTNLADFRVENGYLQVDDMAALGTGAITLAGSIVSAGNVDTAAVLEYSGATASSNKPLTLDASGGGIWVTTTGTTLTLSGVIGETGGTGRALSVYGDFNSGSVLTLTAANTYTGPTAVNYGSILSIPTIANGGVASPLGAASSSPSNLILGGGSYGGDGTLEYTGPTASTDRGVTLGSAIYNSTINVAAAAATLTMSGQFTGAGALTKAGAGTLLLTNFSNNYSNGTIVNAGTLAVGASGAVLPSCGNVTVNGGATFNYGNGATVGNFSSAIGTLTLNSGTYRVSGGAGDFFLNQLVIGPTGGSVDFTGTTDFFTHFTGIGAGITVNASSTWTGASDSRIENDTSALLPFAINGTAVVTSSVNFANGAGFGFRLVGDNSGVLYLKNPTAGNTADFRVEHGFLEVDQMAALGTGAITLAGPIISAGHLDSTARLEYSGATASSAEPLTLDGSGGDIWVRTSGTTLTLTGVIGETGGTGRALTVYGDNNSGSILTLTAANTYTGPTAINYGGILSIPTIANGGVASPLGAASNDPAYLQLGGGVFFGDGTLEYTGPTASTDRGVTLAGISFKSTINVATAGTMLTMSGQFTGVGALTKAGPGTLVLTNSSNNYDNGTIVNGGTLAVGANGAVLLSGGNVTVNSGATFNYGNGSTISNAGSAIGTLTLNNGTYQASGNNGDFHLNQLVIGSTGGSVDFSATSNFWTQFTGSGAGITVNASSTWTGASRSRIQNDTNALLPFTINSYPTTVTSSLNFADGLHFFGFNLLGGGVLYLKNPADTSTADFSVENGYLRVDDIGALGIGGITLAGSIIGAGYPDTTAVLQYSGAMASSNKPLTLDGSGGVILVSDTGTTLTLTGVIGETGGTGRALSVYGDFNSGSILTLTAANTYTGPTAISFGGVLSIPTIANGGVASTLGASSNSPANLQVSGGAFGGDGTLEYTGPTAGTDRGVTLGSAIYNSTINVATAGTTLTVSGQFTGPGALTKAGPGTLVLTNGSNNYANGTNVNAGTLTFTPAAAIPSGAVTVAGGATLDLNANTSGGMLIRTLSSLTINSGGKTAVVTPTVHANRTLFVNSGLSIAGSAGAWTGTLDLGGNDMIVRGGSLTDITSQVKSGFNAGGSYWNGLGITSSAAQSDTKFLTTLGVLQPSAAGTFDSQSYSTSDVLVKYTYYGDADLSGTVNGADYQQVDKGFGMHLTGWSNGDFNYDGVVDGSDFSLIDNTFNKINSTGASPMAIIAPSTALFAGPLTTAVPDPSSFTAVGIAAMCILSARRRRRS